MRPELVKKSRLLSRVLRHDPGAIGVELDASGWIDVGVLLAALQEKRRDFSHDCLLEIVATNDKRRFVLSEDGARIRAAQGHTLGIDLELAPSSPPAALFHGTALRKLPAIREQGLRRGKRDHVHLSLDTDTARTVGARYGEPVVLTVDATGMEDSGYVFYLSENDVWLTDSVPLEFIEFPD